MDDKDKTPVLAPKPRLEPTKPVTIPICPTCKKPLTQCACTHNDLSKGKK